MRKSAILLSLCLCTAVAVGSIARAEAPEKLPAQVQVESGATLTGSRAELDAALQEPSSIRYKLLVVDENPADRTAYLDEVLAKWGWPAADEMLLLLFPEANYDLRFALGANFRLGYVSVDDVLGLVRSEYFPRSQKGDAYGGLAALVRAVNRRTSPAGVNAYQVKFEAIRQAVAYIERQDADGLLAMARPGGIHAAPYAVGLPDEGLSPEKARQVLTRLTPGGRLQVLGYDLSGEEKISVVLGGLNPGLELFASGTEESRVTSTDRVVIGLLKVGADWKLHHVAFDTGGRISQALEGSTYQKPFAWFEVTEGDSLSIGYGSKSSRQDNTTQQLTTQSLREALTYLGQGANLPAWLEGKHMIIHRSFTADYLPTTTSLMTVNPAFHASYSPEGTHGGFMEKGPNYTVSIEYRTINGRPAMIISADEQREGGWKNRHLYIEDGNWMYHLDDGQGNLDLLLEMAGQIPPLAPAPGTA